MKKNYIYITVAIVAVIGATIFWVNRNNKVDNIADTSTSISPSPSQSLAPTPTPKTIKSSPKPTPGIIAKEGDNYQYWVNLLDSLNRRLTLNGNCTSIAPSQVTYPNNTQIMLDNTLSSEPRILKIGAKNYSLTAKGWLLVTLISPELPAKLTMFCGPMELGQLDLQ